MGEKLAIVWETQTLHGVEVTFPRLNLDPLKYFEKLRNELTTVDSVNGPLFMRDLNRAYEAVAKLAANIELERDNAVIEAKHQKAIAALERSSAYLKERDLKETDKTRESYADIDLQYRLAAERVNQLNALAKFMNVKAKAFQAAHDDAKKIYDRVSFGAQNKGGSFEGGYSESHRDIPGQPAGHATLLFDENGEEIK